MKNFLVTNRRRCECDRRPVRESTMNAFMAACLLLIACFWGCSGSDSGGGSGPQYQAIGSFSDNLAPVKIDSKWGYIDTAGKLIIPAKYDTAEPFVDGYAAVEEKGKWSIIDAKGNTVTVPKQMTQVGAFSQGLAPAKTSAYDSWGYVDTSGKFVLQPKYTKVDLFSGNLAPVMMDNTWSYIGLDGSVAIPTKFYRAYPFSEDGLALVHMTLNGNYGYIGKDGTVKIPAIFPEAGAFSGGLAPVRNDKGWGYIKTDGTFAIEPKFQYATPFRNGVAFVKEGDAYHYIGKDGKALFAGSFAYTEPFSDGIAKVGDGKSLWYIDASGRNLGIGGAVPVQDGGQCGSGTTQNSVQTQYTGGLVHFRIVNQTNLTWSIAQTDKTSPWTWSPTGGYTMGENVFIPGVPASVAPNATTSFFVKYVSIKNVPNSLPDIGWGSGNYGLFDLSLTSGAYSVKLANTNAFTNPPPPQDTPWWDYLKDGLPIIEAAVYSAEGNFLAGIADLTKGTYDLINGTVDKNGNNNVNQQTSNAMVTTLTGTYSGGSMNPPSGSYCGGDVFTLSDGANYVFELATAKSTLAAPEVQIYIMPYNMYWARNALTRLNVFRTGSDGQKKLSGPLFSCVYSLAFASQSDTTNDATCSTTTYNYWSAAAKLSFTDIGKWVMLANNLSDWANSGNSYSKSYVQQAISGFGGWCGALDPSCPVFSISPSSLNASTSLGGQCSWPVTVYNLLGTLSISGNSGVSFVPGTCSNPPQSQCSITVSANPGVSATVSVSSNSGGNVPLSVKCTAVNMTLSPSTLPVQGGASGCTWQMQANNTAGAVTATGPSGTSFNQGTCTAATTQGKSCTFSVSAPPATQGTFTVTDTKTTFNLPYQCTAMYVQPTSVPGTRVNASTCQWSFKVYNPYSWESITVTGPPLGSPVISCLPDQGCNPVTVQVQSTVAGAGGTATVSDTKTTQQITLQPCQ